MLKELSPQLLQHAADVAYNKGRYSQSDNFQNGADAECAKDFNMEGVNVSPRRITYMNDKLRCILNCDGQYSISTTLSSKSSEHGYINAGSREVPRYMKTKDVKLARMIAKWWNMYGQVELPMLQDWHSWVDYGISFMRESVKITADDIIREVRNVLKEAIEGQNDPREELSMAYEMLLEAFCGGEREDIVSAKQNFINTLNWVNENTQEYIDSDGLLQEAYNSYKQKLDRAFEEVKRFSGKAITKASYPDSVYKDVYGNEEV